MTSLSWARAFIDQSILDCDLAKSLYDIINNEKIKAQLGSKPELYCPAIYAYCQQAIEKALKALLWYEVRSIPKKHNPLNKILQLKQMKRRNLPSHLDIIFRNKKRIDQILNMAPGASYENAGINMLLKQVNTEYPFIALDGTVKLPCQEISRNDVIAALKIMCPLILHIRKYLEVIGLAPSYILSD